MRKLIAGLVLASNLMGLSVVANSENILASGQDEYLGEYTLTKADSLQASKFKPGNMTAKELLDESQIKSLEECLVDNTAISTNPPPLVSMWFLNEDKILLYTGAPLNDDFLLGVHHYHLEFDHAFSYNHDTKKIARAYLVAYLDSDDLALFRTNQDFSAFRVGKQVSLNNLDSYVLSQNLDIALNIYDTLTNMVAQGIDESYFELEGSLYEKSTGVLARVESEKLSGPMIFLDKKVTQGSSGAPLYSENKLVGVLSFCIKDNPQIASYTSAVATHSFIDSLVNQFREYNARQKQD